MEGKAYLHSIGHEHVERVELLAHESLFLEVGRDDRPCVFRGDGLALFCPGHANFLLHGLFFIVAFVRVGKGINGVFR